MRLDNRARPPRIGPKNAKFARLRPESRTGVARGMFASGWKGTFRQLAEALNITPKKAQEVIRHMTGLDVEGRGADGGYIYKQKGVA